MPDLNLQMSYLDFLRNTRSEKIQIATPSSLSAAGKAPEFFTVTIPPLNSINLFSEAPRVSITDMIATAGANVVALPVSFDWRQKLPTLTKPFDQGACGCCWAVAVATVMSDIFQISGSYPKDPKISVSYILSCYGNSMKCGGGNPFLCLQWTSSHGVGTDAIIDYSWCLNSQTCKPSSSRKIAIPNPAELNKQIPPCKEVSNPLLFFTKDTKTASLEATDTVGSPNYEIFSHTIKTHILQVGPVVGGFQVFKNLFTGKFASPHNPDGIYLENVDYVTHTWNPALRQFAGSHAVAIIGWGVGQVRGRLLGPSIHKNDVSLQEKMFDVPYWIVRNSWSENWGQKGCYYHARFPFNQISQFDVLVNVSYPVLNKKTQTWERETVPTSGILMTHPDTFIRASTEFFESPSCTIDNGNNDQFFMAVMIGVTILIFLIIIFLLFPYKSQNGNKNALHQSTPKTRS